MPELSPTFARDAEFYKLYNNLVREEGHSTNCGDGHFWEFLLLLQKLHLYCKITNGEHVLMTRGSTFSTRLLSTDQGRSQETSTDLVNSNGDIYKGGLLSGREI